MSEKEVRRRLLETSKMISELRDLIENRSDRKYDESTSHGLSKLVGPFGSVDDSFSPSVDPASQDKIEQDIIKSLEEVDSRLQSQDYEQALALIEFVVEALPSILPSDHFLVVKANSIYKKCESYKVIKLVQEVLVTPSTVLIETTLRCIEDTGLPVPLASSSSNDRVDFFVDEFLVPLETSISTELRDHSVIDAEWWKVVGVPCDVHTVKLIGVAECLAHLLPMSLGKERFLTWGNKDWLTLSYLFGIKRGLSHGSQDGE